MPVHIGRAAHLLTGPWRFHLGDDMRWAAPQFDASRWESVDLTPAPGAHDGDVGLTDYVPGWWARGHDGYTGYAWYRLHVTVDAPVGTDLALLAPAYVEDAYQVFWNGVLIGGIGDFSGTTPVIYSTRPRVFHVPVTHADDAVIAIRVWMRPGLARVADAGGMHIAPMLGTGEAINAQYQLDWLETFKGYVVEVVEPLAFVLLAVLAWCLRAAISRGRFVPWLCAALWLTAAYRLNQATFTWFGFESLSVYLAVHWVLIPLGLAAWIMTWRHWYQLERWRWLTCVIGGITALSVVLVLTLPHDLLAMLRPLWRVPLAVVLLATAIIGLRKRQPDRLLTFVVVLFVAGSQFSGALTALGVPGIWFPFGTGVSLTQYLYVGIIVGLAVMLVRIVQRAVTNRHAGDRQERLSHPGKLRV
ncbi:MAG TPA: glycoside hydrolase family 2 [Oleiagrimonas sp.]|nr:glycoside hydrolase family 2 [Oleiagrimonas sp.]